MPHISKTAAKQILRTLLSHQAGQQLHSRLAVLALLFGSVWVESAMAGESDAAADGGLKLNAADRKALSDLRDQLATELSAAEVASVLNAVSQVADDQIQFVAESLAVQPANDLSALQAWLQAQVEAAEALLAQSAEGADQLFADDEVRKAIESEFGGAEGTEKAAEAASKVTVETAPAGAAAAGESLGIAPAFALGPVLGGAAVAGAVAVAAGGGGGGGGGTTTGGTGGTGGGTGGTTTVNGLAVDGYLQGSTVSVRNADGSLTQVGTTNAQGQFVGLDNTLGLKLTTAQAGLTIVVTGGTDASTGRPFEGTLSAPAGSTVVTPLTTVVVSLLQANPSLDVSEAVQLLKARLNLPDAVDLLNLDPIAAFSDGGDDAAMALEVYQKGLAIMAFAARLDQDSALVDFDAALERAIASLVDDLIDAFENAGGDFNAITAAADPAALANLFAAALAGLSDVNAAALLNFIIADIGTIDGATDLDGSDSARNEVETDEVDTDGGDNGGGDNGGGDNGGGDNGGGDTDPVSVELSESELAALLEGGVADNELAFDGDSFDPAALVTLSVDGSTLSDSGLDYIGLSLLGVDTIDVGSGADIELGFARLATQLGSEELVDQATGDSFNPARFVGEEDAEVTLGLEQGEVNELELLFETNNQGVPDTLEFLSEIGVDSIALTNGGTLTLTESNLDLLRNYDLTIADSFTDENGPSDTVGRLLVEGSTLADSDLTLADLALLGVDSVAGSGSNTPRIDIELGLGEAIADLFSGNGGSTGNQGGNAGEQLSNFIFSHAPTFADAANVTLGLSDFEFTQLEAAVRAFVSGNGDEQASNPLQTLASRGIDAIASTQTEGGVDGNSLIISQALADALGTAGIRLADSFHLAEGGADTVSSHVVVEATVLSGEHLLGADSLAALGIDEVRFIDVDQIGDDAGFGSLTGAIEGIRAALGLAPLGSEPTSQQAQLPQSLDHTAVLGTNVVASVVVDIDPALAQQVESFLTGLATADASHNDGAAAQLIANAGATVLEAVSQVDSLTDLGIDRLVIGDGTSVTDIIDLDNLDFLGNYLQG